MEEPPVVDGERIVISGMSGLFPQASHVKDLEEILYDKVILMGATTAHFFLKLGTSFHLDGG